MTETPFTLEQMLAPVSAGKFLREYREREPLFVRASHRGKFQNLLTLENLDQLLATRLLRPPDCRLVRDGSDISPGRYVLGEGAAGTINLDAVYGEYRKGATIVVNGLHRHWPPLAEFCRSLERCLSVGVQANTYLTPKGSQGFGAHYDGHDVFIVQIHGKKHWRLYDSPLMLPTERQPFNSTIARVGRVRQRCTLRAGDLLYIPRGCIHDATAASEASLHITIGIDSTTWGDVLVESLRLLIETDPALRQSLPAGFADGPSTPRAVRAKLARLAGSLAPRLPVDDALEEFADRFAAHRPPHLEGQLVALEKGGPVEWTTTLVRRNRLVFRSWRARGKVGLIFHRKKIAFPAFVAPALKKITTAASFKPGDLPGGLTRASRLLLCRRLAEEGFLRIAGERDRVSGASAPS